MTTVTDADREAAADYFGMTNDALRADFARSGKYDLSVCVQAFARHRHQARAELVGEIVAELRELHWTHRDAEPAKRLAGMIEAKFGGRDGNE